MSLLDLSDLGSILQSVITPNGLIQVDRSHNDVADSTLHLVAEILCLSEVLSLDGSLYLSGELGQIHLTRSGTDSEEALDTEADNGEEKGKDKTYHETSLIHCTKKVSRMTAAVATDEVIGVTHNEIPYTITCESANYEDNPCSFNTLEALFFSWGCSLCCCCHNVLILIF